jgi:PKD repeat protein
MNRIMNSALKRIPVRGLLVAACIVSLALQPFTVGAAVSAAPTTLTALWIAGGLDSGSTGAGNSARIASDSSGNVTVVSGGFYRMLVVTSYTSTGALRWQRTVTPSSGTFAGDWVVAAPNGDLVVIGHNQDSHGRPIASTMLRYTSDGTLLWRVDFSASFFPSVARLVVDAAGNAYVAWSAVGSGLFVQKYSPSGALLWSQQDSSTGNGYAIASSLALSPDGVDVAVTGSVSGGSTWITTVYNATTGVRRWQVTAADGLFARDVVVDATRVYATGQGVTDPGTPAMKYFLTVVAYDRATGARLWRTDKKPADAYDAAGLWMAKAPDGSIVVTGQTNRGFLDWYTVAFETTGAVRWEAVRDGGLNTDEIPAGVLVLADGTTVVTGRGGPNLPGGYWPGVTAGYSSNGTLLWEGFSKLVTVWATALPNGDVCATGGYDALITCWRPSGGVLPNQLPTAVMSANPLSGTAPLTVTFDGSASTDPDGSVTTWLWRFGDGSTATGAVVTHTYTTNGITYYPSLTVADNRGGSSFITGSPIVVTYPLPPEAPSLLTASFSGASVVLTWQDNSSSELGFYIERCEGAGCTNFIGLFGDTSANISTYTDSLVTAGTTYGYRVVAYNAGGYSAYSNIASIAVGGVSTPSPTPVPTNTPTNTPAPGTSTGFLSPSANAAQTSSAGDNNGYQTSPANAYANDSSVATDTNSGTNTNTSCTNNGKDNHYYYNYNLNIPATAVIQGIQVRLDARADAASSSPKICVQLSWDGGTTWTTARSTMTLGTTEATYILGSTSDTWSRTWNPGNFSNTNFRIRVIDVAGNTSRDFFLDYIAVNVTYQP